VRELTDDIHAVDSFSKDNTVEILREYGCKVVQRTFANYADQRNWAIDNLKLKYSWQLHIDADEELEPQLVHEIKALNFDAIDADGFIIGRKIVFLGKVLRFGGIAKTWHYRLFRTGFGRCEDRLYDQHFVGSGRTKTINAFMLDHQEDTISEWTARHNRWSDMEAVEADNFEDAKAGQIRPSFTGNRIERVRAGKGVYYRLPLFARACAYFLYRYVIRLGFADGRSGLIYSVLQGFWFRFLVDAKIYEARLKRNG
jgi:glycosyltransferase involved in cell wall biosynthesis